MSSGGYQHHHGVKKNLFDVVGGLLVGSAMVLLFTRLLKRKN